MTCLTSMPVVPGALAFVSSVSCYPVSRDYLVMMSVCELDYTENEYSGLEIRRLSSILITDPICGGTDKTPCVAQIISQKQP